MRLSGSWCGRRWIKNVRLADLSAAELQEVDASLDESLRGALGVENAIARFVSYGSTAPKEVERQVSSWRETIENGDERVKSEVNTMIRQLRLGLVCGVLLLITNGCIAADAPASGAA